MSTVRRSKVEDILIVDDEADICILVAGVLEDEGFGSRDAYDSDAALRAIEERRPSLVLLDIWLQGSRLDGLQLLEQLKREHPALPIVIMSGHGTIETAVQAIKLGAYDFIEKPFNSDRLILVTQRAIETARLRRENEELRQRGSQPTEMIGRSTVMNQLRQSIERVAPTNSRVLITGPAGSGKEVVARMIHARSTRAEGPFVVMSCASMAPERIEMEIFGVEGGIDGLEGPRKIGTFEAAHNGTLYLDEVADMPLESQGKIVRVLQEQVFQRVGGSTPVNVDVRVIASTTRDLTAEIGNGRFREDLFYRLSVVPLRVPALRERRDDIPLLAVYFMERAAEAQGHRPRALNDDAMATLQAHEWPGNVRELRNIIERLLIMAPGGVDDPIRADMLPPELESNFAATRSPERNTDIMSLPLRDAREIFEREYLLAQVTRFGGNISRTAAFVGMERSALHRKLKSLGIQTDEKFRNVGP